MVEAVTGSGKTLAFVVPILEILLKLTTPLKKHDVGALIISPTRELGLQIFNVIESFLKKINLTAILFVGGNSVNDDLNKFEANGGNIVVATAGRLEDLFTRQTQKFNIKKGFKSLVIYFFYFVL